MLELIITPLIILFVWLCGAALLLIILLMLGPSHKEREADLKEQLTEARITQVQANTALTRERTKQLPEQTEGITRRYLMTTENTENAIIRQQKQQIEILKLQLQVLSLQRELGIQTDADKFKPQDYTP